MYQKLWTLHVIYIEVKFPEVTKLKNIYFLPCSFFYQFVFQCCLTSSQSFLLCSYEFRFFLFHDIKNATSTLKCFPFSSEIMRIPDLVKRKPERHRLDFVIVNF